MTNKTFSLKLVLLVSMPINIIFIVIQYFLHNLAQLQYLSYFTELTQTEFSQIRDQSTLSQNF